MDYKMPTWMMTESKMIGLYGHVFDFDLTNYGIAPHDHDWQMLVDGKIGRGATIPQKLTLNAHGHFVGNGYIYVPDQDCPGCGTFYYHK